MRRFELAFIYERFSKKKNWMKHLFTSKGNDVWLNKYKLSTACTVPIIVHDFSHCSHN